MLLADNMKRLYIKYITLSCFSVISLLTTCVHKKEEEKQNKKETLNEYIGDNKENSEQ